MKVEFYKCSSAPNRIDKTDFLEKTYEATNVKPKATESVLRINFEMKYRAEIFRSNYLYCQQTGRYYFIDDIQLMIGNRINVICSVDVLHTYRESILSEPAWVQSATSIDTEQKMLNNDFPFQQNEEIESWVFPNSHFLKSFSGESNIVVVTI